MPLVVYSASAGGIASTELFFLQFSTSQLHF